MLSSIPPFIVTITTFIEYRCSLVERPDLFCNSKNIAATTVETSAKRFCKGLTWFLELPYCAFYLPPSRIKIGCSKVGSILVSNFFLYTLKWSWIKHQKSHKAQKSVETPRKGREKCTNKLQESILNDEKKGSRDTTNTSNETTSPTTDVSNESTNPANNAITIRSNGAYIHSIGIHAALAIGVCVLLAYKTTRLANKKQINEKQNRPLILSSMF